MQETEMAFVGVEFEDESLAVVHAQWLTPRKQNVHQPAALKHKNNLTVLRKGVVPEDKDNWKLSQYTTLFFLKVVNFYICFTCFVNDLTFNIQDDFLVARKKSDFKKTHQIFSLSLK